MAMYSASKDDMGTVVCFLDFQDTKDSLMNIQNPVIDLLESGKDAKFESVNALSCGSLEELRKMPYMLYL